MEELERTFLLKEFPPNFETSRSKEMLDIYIPSTSDHPHLRIRKSGDKFEITNKQPLTEGDSSHQQELTIPLTETEYLELSTISGKRVAKMRHYYSEQGTSYEIDVFTGPLRGLVLVDVEFETEDAKNSFVPPPWCPTDVTQEKFIAGGMLCGKSYTDIEHDLDRFQYEKQEV